jgi:HPt (histidine-containing phosphotransfer) domain-containing protein
MSASLHRGLFPAPGLPACDAAHRLKPAARAIGAMRLGEFCTRIERATRARRPGERQARLPLFEAEAVAVLGSLDARASTAQAGAGSHDANG